MAEVRKLEWMLSGAIWQTFPSWTSTVNECNLHLFDLSHSRATSSGGNWNPSGIYAERDPFPHILSCHYLQTTIVTGWQIVRGPQPDSCLRERDLGGGVSGGGQGRALDSCLLSSQSSLFIFLPKIAWSTLQNARGALFDRLHLCLHLTILKSI